MSHKRDAGEGENPIPPNRMPRSVSVGSRADHPVPSRNFRILLIGPLPPPVGGDTTPFQYLVDDLSARENVSVSVINISRGTSFNNWFVNLRVAIRTAGKLAWRVPRVDLVSFHASMRGRIIFGPVVYLIARLFGRPAIMRAFGGGFKEQYESLGSLWKWLLRKTYFNSAACLFETKRLVSFFRSVPIRRAEWFSNYTRIRASRDAVRSPQPKEGRKFVFLGRIQKDKGIEILLESGPLLEKDIVIDLFGRLRENYSKEEIDRRGGGKVHYRGVLGRDDLGRHLENYDALVLPTLYPREGYPGVILEAYACGLAVIASRWIESGIVEIVDERSGILVEPGSASAFAEAVNRFRRDPSLRETLRSGARSRSREFSDVVWTNRFLTLCAEILASR